MINIYFAKPSRSIGINERVVKTTHIKSKCITYMKQKVLQKYHTILLVVDNDSKLFELVFR